TAWALRALAQIAPNVIHAEDVTTLRREMHADGSIPALAWGLLALHDLGQDDPVATDRLWARQAADGGWEASPYHSAIAWMALAHRPGGT
ncbi:MAG: hypothetical protein N2439_12580, partial [Anaerolineae bacterium]|nr:hypothetical protein [Anaerolineae bacterium]